MTTQEALKRSEKAQYLRTWQVDDTWFYVESEDGKIAYKCCIADAGDYCNCGDFAQKSKNDPHFKCKHLLAVMNSIPRNQVLEAQFLEKRKPKLDERFIKSIDGKDFVLYSGLLDLAHQKNLTSMDVDLIQYPSKENDHTAICKAIARTVTGGPFIDVGDANPMNCNSKVSKHIIRMASTRAKARCLRDLTNIGMTCLEELGDLTDVIGEDHEKRSYQPKRDNVKSFAKPAKKENEAVQVNANPAPQPEIHYGLMNSDAGKNELQCGKEEQSPAIDNANASAEGRSQTEANHAETEPQTEKKPRAAKPDNGNGNGNGNGKAKTDKVIMMSEAQKSALFNLSRRRGISLEDLEGRSMEKYGIPTEQLTSGNAGEFIRYLQQSA